MVTMFAENPTLPSRAVQIWQILVCCAHNRRSITNIELASLLHYAGAGTLGRQLEHIMHLCTQNDLPPLTVLVVNSESGIPGQGFLPNGDPIQLTDQVFNFNWFGIVPPSEEDYVEAMRFAHNELSH